MAVMLRCLGYVACFVHLQVHHYVREVQYNTVPHNLLILVVNTCFHERVLLVRFPSQIFQAFSLNPKPSASDG